MNSDPSPTDCEALDPVRRVQAWLTGLWRKDAGPLVDIMLKDRAETERQLKHPDWKVRCTALSILELHWHATDDTAFAQTCEDTALRDVHPQVRSCALRILGVCHANRPNSRIGRLLASVVLDETQPAQCRNGAYLGLYHLRGLRVPRLTDQPTVPRIPDDFDWTFVKSFL